MFVRFRSTKTRLQVSLIETRRINGKVKHDHIAALGSILDMPTIADRIALWKSVHERLARLSNRIDVDTYRKILEQIHARVPMVTPDEQRQLQHENAEADAKFWSGLASMHDGTTEEHKALAGTVQRAIADGEAAAAQAIAQSDAAKERLARIDRGEDVSGGLGKPMTHEDMIAILRKEGFTDRDLRRCRTVAEIAEAGALDELQAEIIKRREQSEWAAIRAVKKRHKLD